MPGVGAFSERLTNPGGLGNSAPRISAPYRLRHPSASTVNRPADPIEKLTSLILPAYNPGPAIDATWEAVCEFLNTARDSWEVIFVCDGCSDGTSDRLRRLGSFGGLPVRVLDYPENRGKGYAVRRGLLAARGQWRIFTDVDLAYGFDEIVGLARELRQGADVAIASREHPESQVLCPAQLLGYLYRRRLQSRLFSAAARLLLPIRQRDTQAGLKGLSATAVGEIVPRLRCDGFGFDCELLTACARLGFSVTEVPVRVMYRDAVSTTGGRAIWRMLGDLLRIRREWKRPPAPLPAEAAFEAAFIAPAQAPDLVSAAA
jgi:glycosyltransferase involved in cell wall biosynthesis